MTFVHELLFVLQVGLNNLLLRWTHQIIHVQHNGSNVKSKLWRGSGGSCLSSRRTASRGRHSGRQVGGWKDSIWDSALIIAGQTESGIPPLAGFAHSRYQAPPPKTRHSTTRTRPAFPALLASISANNGWLKQPTR
jgi:hypothetical protein